MRIKIDRQVSLSEVASAVCGKLNCDSQDLRVSYITTDSREVCSGDLFFALCGEQFDGEDFCEEAIAKGAIVITKKSYKNSITVQNTNDALLNLAQFYKSRLPCLKWTVAITGSVGKTTTKDFTKILLSEGFRTHATRGNYNNSIGLPLTILTAPWDTELLIAEIGMNHRGEIEKLSKCLLPDIAVILNVGTSHIGNLGSRENIAMAKLEIRDGLKKDGILLIPEDEPLLSGLGKTFSAKTNNANYSILGTGEKTISIYENKINLFNTEFALTEHHFQECLAASSAIALSVGIKSNQLKQGISKISYNNTKQKIIRIGEVFFFTDYYNSSIESILADLHALSALKSYKNKSVLLGDVLELGESSEKIHFTIGQKLAEFALSNIYLFGKFAKFIYLGAVSAGINKKTIHINEDITKPEITAADIKKFSSKGEIILAKASRKIKLERVLSCFEQ